MGRTSIIFLIKKAITANYHNGYLNFELCMTNDTLQIEKLITAKYYSDRLNFEMPLA